MRRRKKKRESDEVGLNLAAMLDMAFQLLAFFILTFRPNPVEGQINLNLPPPVPAAWQGPLGLQPFETPDETRAKTLVITVTATAKGDVGPIYVGLAKLFEGPLDAKNLGWLDRRLQDIFAIEGAFDQILLRVAKPVTFGELVKVIDVCAKQKTSEKKPVRKIGFVALKDE